MNIYGHLNNELKLCGKPQIKNDNVTDTLVLARDKFPGASISLDALCKRYRIDNSKSARHTALIDCQLLKDVYINLLDQKEPKLNLESKEIFDLKFKNKSHKSQSGSEKVVKPSVEELNLHKTYLKTNLSKNYYD